VKSPERFGKSKGKDVKAQSKRKSPVEFWPESQEILRYLCSQSQPVPVKSVSGALAVPEISTRNRLLKLAAANAVRSTRIRADNDPDSRVYAAHYEITQYGRDCAAGVPPRDGIKGDFKGANSVFAWAQPVNLSK